MEDANIQRLILKDGDVLVVKVPGGLSRNLYDALYKRIKKQLLPRKNKILILPNAINFTVIGEKEIREHISNVDLWSLWDEDGEEIGQGDVE